MTMENQVSVLVVGAGPVGLFLTRELIRHGIHTRIVEKATEQSCHSKALAIMPRTLELFDMAGVVAPFVAEANPVRQVSSRYRDRVLGRVPFQGTHTHYPHIAMLPQDRTEALLLAALEAAGGRVEYHSEVVAIEPRADGVRVQLAAGADIQARYVVGCDGARSTVRSLLGLPFEGGDYPETFVLADIETAPDWPADEMQVCPNEAGAIACFPMNAGRRRIMAMVEQDYTGTPDLAFIQQLMAARGLAGLEARKLLWAGRFRIHHRGTPDMRRGSVFLAGDAAHIHSPFGGQGMNTGLQDAWNLAWKLRFALAGWAGDALLDSYSSERHAVVQAVIRNTDVLTRVVATRKPWLVRLRNQAIRTLTRLPAFRAKFVATLSGLGVRYASGARAADEPIEHPSQTLFRILGQGYVLLIPPRLEPSAFEVLSTRYTDCLTVVPARDTTSRIRLVRPDGYLAYEAPARADRERAIREIGRRLAVHLQRSV